MKNDYSAKHNFAQQMIVKPFNVDWGIYRGSHIMEVYDAEEKANTSLKLTQMAPEAANCLANIYKTIEAKGTDCIQDIKIKNEIEQLFIKHDLID